jgi:cytochrome c-type biogenesis protein CcmH
VSGRGLTSVGRGRTLGALRAILAALAIVATAALAGPASAAAAAPRASFTDIESDVMCIACHEPLAVAQSPEAFSERAYIRQLIGEGLTKPQIERQLVAQYGPAILAKPPAHGFNLLIYILPPVLLIAGIVGLAIALPRWRRRSRAAAASPLPAGPALDPTDARRLRDDLAQRDA